MALRADDIDLARDRRLVEAWQAGDASAFDDLYRLYFERIRSFCQRRVNDHAEADDLAQEAFLRALQALPDLAGERRFYPWMTVIASRLCIDHHRRRSRVQPSDDLDLGSVDDGHDARVDLQADLHDLDLALRRLGPRHVEVLDLREAQGLTYHQIADRLAVSHSTVETLLFRARKALRREFAAVSVDRWAAVPGLGWLLGRAGRLRDRLAPFASELGPLGGTLAAGAVTAALVILPTAAGPSSALTSGAGSTGAAAVVVVDVPPAPAPPVLPPADAEAVDADPATTPTPAPAPRKPPVRTMTPDQAEREASQMPVHVELERGGVGLDPAPVLAPIVEPLRSQP